MMTRDDYLDGIRALVEEHGWAIQGVFGTEDDPGSFAYTVGMTAIGLPELWVDTLDPRMASQLLNALADRQRNLGVGLAGEVDVNWSVPFRVRGPVDVEAAAAFVATSLYPHPQIVSVHQVMWPDEAGRFPDEDGYSLEALPQRVLPLRGEGGS